MVIESKYFLLGNNITGKVLNLLKSKQKHLLLAAIRFFRAFIGMKDDFYNRHLTKRNLFDPVIQVFKENGAKYNLLNSAIIELFEFIRKENIKILIQHVVEYYGDFFRTVNYVDTFNLLVLKYEQNQENHSASSTPTLSANSLNGSRGEEDDEEYFSTEDAETPVPIVRPEKETEREFKPLISKEKEDENYVFPMFKGRTSSLTTDKALERGEKRQESSKKGKISINLNLHTRNDEDGNGAKKQKT